MSETELQQLAESLGLPLSALKSPGFPTWRAGKGYQLQVTAAKNVVSKRGTQQVELSVVALDDDNQPNVRAKGKIWVAYPFDTAEYKFSAPDRETSITQMGALLEASGDSKFVPYRRVDVGGKTHYFNSADEELKGPAITAAKDATRLSQLKEMHNRMSNPEAWVDTVFFAQYVVDQGKDGKTYRNWKRFSAAKLSQVEYIGDQTLMLTRPENEVADEELPF